MAEQRTHGNRVQKRLNPSSLVVYQTEPVAVKWKNNAITKNRHQVQLHHPNHDKPPTPSRTQVHQPIWKPPKHSACACHPLLTGRQCNTATHCGDNIVPAFETQDISKHDTSIGPGKVWTMPPRMRCTESSRRNSQTPPVRLRSRRQKQSLIILVSASAKLHRPGSATTCATRHTTPPTRNTHHRHANRHTHRDRVQKRRVFHPWQRVHTPWTHPNSPVDPPQIPPRKSIDVYQHCEYSNLQLNPDASSTPATLPTSSQRKPVDAITTPPAQWHSRRLKRKADHPDVRVGQIAPPWIGHHLHPLPPPATSLSIHHRHANRRTHRDRAQNRRVFHPWQRVHTPWTRPDSPVDPLQIPPKKRHRRVSILRIQQLTTGTSLQFNSRHPTNIQPTEKAVRPYLSPQLKYGLISCAVLYSEKEMVNCGSQKLLTKRCENRVSLSLRMKCLQRDLSENLVMLLDVSEKQ